MAGEAEENRLTGTAYRGEEIAGNHLETDDKHRGADDTHRTNGLRNQCGVMREHTRHQTRETLAQDKHNAHDGRRVDRGKVEHAQHTVVLLGAVVVPGDRLHTLIETHDDHREDKSQTVNHTIRRNRQVAPEVLHCIDAQGAETYSNAYTYTLRDYLIGELTNDDNPDAVRTLAADLLNYGAAAQVYFDFDAENLVNENLDAEAAADLAQYQTQNEAPAEKVNSAEGPNLFSSVSIKNRVVLNLTSRGLNTEGNVQVQVKLGDTVKATLDTTKVGSVYTARYDQIEAAEMRSEFQFVTLVDGVETGNTLTWSLEGYVNFSRNNPDASPTELALMNAMLKYVDAAGNVNFN